MTSSTCSSPSKTANTVSPVASTANDVTRKSDSRMMLEEQQVDRLLQLLHLFVRVAQHLHDVLAQTRALEVALRGLVAAGIELVGREPAAGLRQREQQPQPGIPGGSADLDDLFGAERLGEDAQQPPVLLGHAQVALIATHVRDHFQHALFLRRGGERRRLARAPAALRLGKRAGCDERRCGAENRAARFIHRRLPGTKRRNATLRYGASCFVPPRSSPRSARPRAIPRFSSAWFAPASTWCGSTFRTAPPRITSSARAW